MVRPPGHRRRRDCAGALPLGWVGDWSLLNHLAAHSILTPPTSLTTQPPHTPVVCLSLLQLAEEVVQCHAAGGLSNYYSQSVWHWVEGVGLGFQLTSDVLWVSASSTTRATSICLGWGAFVTILKSLHFARGFEKAGSFLHTIQHGECLCWGVGTGSVATSRRHLR